MGYQDPKRAGAPRHRDQRRANSLVLIAVAHVPYLSPFASTIGVASDDALNTRIERNSVFTRVGDPKSSSPSDQHPWLSPFISRMHTFSPYVCDVYDFVRRTAPSSHDWPFLCCLSFLGNVQCVLYESLTTMSILGISIALMFSIGRYTMINAQEFDQQRVGSNEEAPVSRILVVDDENGPRQALRMLLKEDYEVEIAESGPDALLRLEEGPFDLVITDLRMPRVSGVELLRQVKLGYPDTEVIILTGFGQLRTAMKAVEYGAFAYLEKPFNNDVMLKQVRSALAKRRSEVERRQFEQLALEANRFDMVGRIVSGMLHDLGTPLSIISSNIELMLVKIDDPASTERLKHMFTQVHHCSDIVRATMGFLRQRTEQMGPINVNEIVDICLKVGQPLLRRQSVEVRSELGVDLPLCWGDFVLIRQAVLNLMTNAVQAMEDQREPRRIIIRTWHEVENLHVSVADSGPGIPPEKRQRVFDAFFSTKPATGTGLGLAVVKHVMHRHGGDVTLTDAGERGTCFVLELPARSAKELASQVMLEP
jgi:signal transduction histidine kinase